MTKYRRIRRVLRFGVFVLLAFGLLLGGAAWWAHRHLTKLIVASANRAYPGLILSAKVTRFSGPGELRLESVRFRVRADQSEVLRVPAMTIHFSWPELRQHYIREVKIESPRIALSDQALAALPVTPEAGSAVGASGDVPWKVGRLSITGGSARIDVASWPLIQCDFATELADDPVQLTPAIGEFRLTSIRARFRNETADAVVIPAITARFSPEELRQLKVSSLIIDAPRVTVSDALLALIPKSSSGGAGEPGWSIGEVAVRKGAVRIDLAALPLLQCDYAASLTTPPDGSSPLVNLEVNNLLVGLRQNGSEALSVAAVKVTALLKEMREQRIREIAVEDPHVSVTDAALEAIQSIASPTTNPAVNTPAPSSIPAVPWKLDRVSIKRGHATVDLHGFPLADCGFAVQLADAALSTEGPGELQSVEISDLALRPRDRALEPFLRIPAVRADVRIPELLRTGRIARVRVEQLDFRYNTAFREMIAASAKPAATEKASSPRPSAGKPPPPITITELRLVEGRIHLNDLGLGVPPIDFRLDTAFRELALTADAGAAGREQQTVELSQIALSSPLDPFFNVLKLDTLFIRFTLAGLWQREIDEVEIVHPVLAIGPDLFWYVDRVQENAAAAPAPVAATIDTGPAWSIRRFNATSGQMVLALEGQRTLAVPMPFESHAENLNFRRLSDLRLKLAIDMPEQDYQYPGYELTLRGVRGRIEFSLPPEKRANNVVNTLHLREVRWKNCRARDFFLDVTYDARGIYGHFGGKAYTGLLNGQFNFLLEDDSPWNGWIAGEHIDLKQMTDVLAPQKVALSGPANFRLSVGARATAIESVIGDYQTTRAGQMRIGKLDDFIQALPVDWSGLKRGLSRISLETLRDFGYDAAHGDFQFHGRSGDLHLDLRGAKGSRKIAVEVHDDAPPPLGPVIVATHP